MVEVVKLDWNAVVNHLNHQLTMLGISFDQLLSCVDDCGCCITLPDDLSHINEERVIRVWDFCMMYDLENYYEQSRP